MTVRIARLPLPYSATCLLFVMLLSPGFSQAANADSQAAGAAPVASCPVATAGAPSCAVGTSPGSTTQISTSHVGNPVDVVSGNKYQREIDYQSFNTGLAFVRHYNSSLTEHDLGLGPGWRHSYHVALYRASNTRLNVIQSDGRLIGFNLVPGTTSPAVYTADDVADGVLVLGESSNWYLNDGRRLNFHGPFLVEIDFGDQRGLLTLHYRDKRLDTVTDSHNNKLRFHYVSRESALPEYDTSASVQPVGALASIDLPGGQHIRFDYDGRRNLQSVFYPGATAVAYGYDDALWPSQLTSRVAKDEKRHSSWSYDDNGRAVSWSEGENKNGLSISREENGSGEPSAEVIYADGRTEHYTWQLSGGDLSAGDAVVDLRCEGCPVAGRAEPSQRVARLRAVESAPADSDAAAEDHSVPLAGQYAHEQYADTPYADAQSVEEQYAQEPHTEEQAARAQRTEESLHGFQANLRRDATSNRLHGRLERGDYAVELILDVDRLGAIEDLQVGELRLSQLAYQSLTEGLPACAPASSRSQTGTETRTETGERLAQLAAGMDACRDDLLLLLELVNELEAVSGENQTQLTSRAGRNGPPPPDPFCTMPPGKSCADLQEDHEMAVLSACVYPGGTCPARWQPIAPAALGLLDEQFSLNGFDAQLFYDPVRNRFTLAFRGTNNDGDDWESNIEQGKGRWARQYEMAYDLAGELLRLLPGQELNFTGHSLGGGLATLAALRTQTEATVFNTAAVHPNTAVRYGVETEYANADRFIDHVSTDSDPLTGGQRFAEFTRLYGAQSAPGVHTEVPDPYREWMEARQSQLSFWEGRYAMIYHSMVAVIESLETLLDKHCTMGP